MSTLICKSFGIILGAAIFSQALMPLAQAQTVQPATVAPPVASPPIASPIVVPQPVASPPVASPLVVSPPVAPPLVVPPSSTLKIMERPPLLPEGAFLTQVPGSLEPSAGDRGWVFRFQDSFLGEPDRVVQLLPSITLADMIRNHTLAASGTISKFLITGRVTLYHGENFVMPLFATTISEFPARQSRPIFAPPGAWYGSIEAEALAQSNSQLSKQANKDQTIALVRRAFLSIASPLSSEAVAMEQNQKQKMIGGISAQDIEQELVARVGDVQRSMDAARLPALNPGAPNEMKWLQPGRRLHDRLGTVLRDPVNGVWRFVFESSRGRVGEREAELLPCALTESLAKQAQATGGLNSGIISGEITLFEGRSYLLPTSFGGLRTGKLLTR